MTGLAGRERVMRRGIVHRTGLMPPSSGPVKTWCGIRVPLDRTGHVRIPGRRRCRRCEAVASRRKRLGIWPWGRE